MLLAALWILGILLALILLLLFLRVGVHITFGEALKVDACVGPVRIAVVPKKKKPSIIALAMTEAISLMARMASSLPGMG